LPLHFNMCSFLFFRAYLRHGEERKQGRRETVKVDGRPNPCAIRRNARAVVATGRVAVAEQLGRSVVLVAKEKHRAHALGLGPYVRVGAVVKRALEGLHADDSKHKQDQEGDDEDVADGLERHDQAVDHMPEPLGPLDGAQRSQHAQHAQNTHGRDIRPLRKKKKKKKKKEEEEEGEIGKRKTEETLL
jgi:hypothetical protein